MILHCGIFFKKSSLICAQFRHLWNSQSFFWYLRCIYRFIFSDWGCLKHRQLSHFLYFFLHFPNLLLLYSLFLAYLFLFFLSDFLVIFISRLASHCRVKFHFLLYNSRCSGSAGMTVIRNYITKFDLKLSCSKYCLV